MPPALRLLGLRTRRTWRAMVAIAAVATALGAVWWEFDLVGIGGSELAAYDDGVKKFTGQPWFPWGAVEKSEDIVILALDDQTIADVAAFPAWREAYGTWPFDRRLYAHLVTYLHEVGARALVLDQTMEESRADPTGELALAEALEATRLPFYLGFNFSVSAKPLPTIEPHNPPLPPRAPPRAADAPTAPPPTPAPNTGEDEDEAFPEEPAAGEPLPGQAGEADEATDGPSDAGTAAALLERVARAYAFPVTLRGGLTLRTPPDGEGAVPAPDGGTRVVRLPAHPVPAIPPVLEPAAGFGVVLHEPDEDGKMRRTRFAYTDGANVYVTLPVAVVADLEGAQSVTLEPGALHLGPRRVRVDRDGAAWVRYGGKLTQRFHTRPLSDVLRSMENRRLDALLRGKIVVVGGFGVGMGDSKATPLEDAVPGVVKQAAVIDNLLHDTFVTDAPYAVSLLLTFLVCLLSTALALVVRNSLVDIAWPVLLFFWFFLLTGSFLTITHVHVLSAMPSLAGTLASIAATAWERFFADKERERLKEMFRSYMEADLVDLMVEQQELPKLDGEVRRITVFFSDIRGFSSFSERLRDDPKSLMRLLNRYLSTVTPAITKHGACIDKYIGDAVVALFGAPVAHGDHALRACKAALDVQRALGSLREALRAEGMPDLYTRIGLNTADLLVGNVGSEQLLDYTAIGDGMNLASRLEGANKAYGTLILIGESTHDEAKDAVVARELDVVRVAGKHLAARVYELVGLAGEVPRTKLGALERYAAALALYRARDFAGAVTALTLACSLAPDDGPSAALLERCRALAASPPAPDWDGVWELEK